MSNLHIVAEYPRRAKEDVFVQLRARDGRAVLAEDEFEFGLGREVDPDRIALDGDLVQALHEWAKVADAVTRAEPGAEGVAGSLVSRRGRQLAGRLAALMGAPVSYLDPVTGEVTEVTEPDWPVGHQLPEEPRRPAEPTPWATGLTLTAFTAIVVVLAVVTLSFALGQASGLLAVAANVVIAAGLAPSVWLARQVPVWRWVAYGVVAGIGMAWITLLLSLL